FKSKSKSKLSYTTCRASKNAKNLRLEKGGWLVLPKIPGRVRTSVSQNPKGVLVSATITKNRSGKWFVSLNYEQHLKAPVVIDNLGCMANPIGLDLGVKDLAITSDGDVFENPKYARKAKEKLARIDRSLSRKREQDRKSTRLNSSHVSISYAVFCLKKKKKKEDTRRKNESKNKLWSENIKKKR